MASESRHIGERIDCPADDIYEYASDPANLPQWAPGLGSSVEKIDDLWFVETSEGRVGFAFAQRNEYGVLDHDVTLPSGEVVCSPMRDRRRQRLRGGVNAAPPPGMSEEDFRADAAAVTADLTRLKHVLDGR
jgi:hypothetical protein